MPSVQRKIGRGGSHTVERPWVEIAEPSLARDRVRHTLSEEERDQEQEEAGDANRLRFEAAFHSARLENDQADSDELVDLRKHRTERAQPNAKEDRAEGEPRERRVVLSRQDLRAPAE